MSIFLSKRETTKPYFLDVWDTPVAAESMGGYDEDLADHHGEHIIFSLGMIPDVVNKVTIFWLNSSASCALSIAIEHESFPLFYSKRFPRLIISFRTPLSFT